ncbi:MAG: nitronate monooxygenase, partial [Bacteroidota bacterium]
ESDPSKMNFGSGGNTKAKAWKDIWGCGQGIGNIAEVMSAGELVAKFGAEYETAIQRMNTLAKTPVLS